jgi:hypothetical protein
MSRVIDYRAQNLGMDPMAKANETLDPAAWDACRKQARHMLGDVDYLENTLENVR